MIYLKDMKLYKLKDTIAIFWFFIIIFLLYKKNNSLVIFLLFIGMLLDLVITITDIGDIEIKKFI